MRNAVMGVVRRRSAVWGRPLAHRSVPVSTERRSNAHVRQHQSHRSIGQRSAACRRCTEGLAAARTTWPGPVGDNDRALQGRHSPMDGIYGTMEPPQFTVHNVIAEGDFGDGLRRHDHEGQGRAVVPTRTATSTTSEAIRLSNYALLSSKPWQSPRLARESTALTTTTRLTMTSGR